MAAQAAVAGQFPYVVSLWNHFNVHICSGAIVNEHWVVSVAHCTVGRNPNNVAIAAGSIGYVGRDVYLVSAIINHEKYESVANGFDISVLKAASKIAFADNVKPIPLARQFVDWPAIVVATGWGWTSSLIRLNLKYVQMQSINQTQCYTMVRHLPINITLCASGPADGFMCSGDSGSPLTANNTLVGLASQASACGPKHPSVFTRISEFHQWVEEHTKDLSSDFDQYSEEQQTIIGD